MHSMPNFIGRMATDHQEAIQKSRLPYPMLIHRCCPMLHAMLYRYLGENTVHMNKCVLNAVHASITNKRLLATKVVSNDRCRIQICCCNPLSCCDKSSAVADVHHKGPAQFPQKARTATAPTWYPSIPL